ncbi:MAG TPA: hypothetical protein VM491_02265 [Burkholderiaceae bacterium]|nr:hypothetical protein [Burkholderiaceae bacterium]
MPAASWIAPAGRCARCTVQIGAGDVMHSIIYLIGLIVVIFAILSFFGLR